MNRFILGGVVAAFLVLTGHPAHASSPSPAVSASAITGWPPHASMLGITCPGVDACFAVGTLPPPAKLPAPPPPNPPGGVIAATHDGGASWAIHTDPRSIFSGLACPSPAQCYVITGHNSAHKATFAVAVTQDGGKTWQQHPLRAGTNPQEIACPAITTCVVWQYTAPGKSAPKTAMLITDDGGRTWKASRTVKKGLGSAARLACPTTRICYLYGGFTGTAISQSQDGGMTWRTLPGTDMFALSGVPAHTLATMGGIACPSARVCYAAQGDVRVPYGTVFGTQDGGKHWGQLYRAHGRDYPTGPIACPSGSVCYAVGVRQRDVPADQIILLTRDGGRTWTTPRLPAGPFLACPGITLCYAGSHAGAVFRTADGGRTWQPLP